MRKILFFLALLPASLLAQQRPDPALTPGVARLLTQAQVCSVKWGRDARHVTAAMQRQVAASYRLDRKDIVAYGKGACCEFDHLISRELGGADDVKNLWPQPWVEAKQKDRLENWMHREVCAGRLPLIVAQQALAGDWIAAQQKAGFK